MELEARSQSSAAQRAVSGAILLAFGIAMLAIGWDYPVGKLTQMGPGFIPRAIGILVCVLAAAILYLDISDPKIAPPEHLQWRGLIFISAAILLFAGMIEVTGLLPAIFLSVIISKLAAPSNRPLAILIYASLTTFAGWMLFLVILELPIPAFWR